MPEQGTSPPTTTAVMQPPDRERDAGFRGEGYRTAATLLGLVFVTGLAIVAYVVIRSRRRR
jgi:hypothetical protein